MSAEQPSEPLVSVIVVAYRNRETIGACLDSVAAQDGVACEVLVVDNSPDMGTWAALREARRAHPHRDVSALRPGRNLGFAGGCNLGARHARGRYLLFLNPDAALEPGALATLLDFWENTPGAGLLGPHILDERGRTMRTCRALPSLLGTFLDATGLDNRLGYYKLLRFPHDETRRVPQVIGACMLTTRELYERFQGLDERFFVYFEEVDLCKRMADAGLGVWFVAGAAVSHQAGTSCESEHSAAAMVAQLRKSRALYFRKHFSTPAWLALLALNCLEGLGKALAYGVLYAVRGRRRDLEKAKGFWRVALCPACSR